MFPLGIGLVTLLGSGAVASADVASARDRRSVRRSRARRRRNGGLRPLADAGLVRLASRRDRDRGVHHRRRRFPRRIHARARRRRLGARYARDRNRGGLYVGLRMDPWSGTSHPACFNRPSTFPGLLPEDFDAPDSDPLPLLARRLFARTVFPGRPTCRSTAMPSHAFSLSRSVPDIP